MKDVMDFSSQKKKYPRKHPQRSKQQFSFPNRSTSDKQTLLYAVSRGWGAGDVHHGEVHHEPTLH